MDGVHHCNGHKLAIQVDSTKFGFIKKRKEIQDCPQEKEKLITGVNVTST